MNNAGKKFDVVWAEPKHEPLKSPLNVFNEAVEPTEKEEELPEFGGKADEPKD